MIVYFYCTECNKIYKSTVRENIYYTDKRLSHTVHYSYLCDCGEPAVEIDAGIINIIKTLNEYGLKTLYCCEGHLKKNGDYQPAYITFDNSIKKEFFESLLKVYPLPNGWELETYNNDDYCFPEYDFRSCVTIRYNALNEKAIPVNKFQSIKFSYLNKLMLWVFSLFSSRVKSSDNNG